MMAAIFSGVSGIKSQQTGLNVVANNISNVNTSGYKAQRASFSDLLNQTLASSSRSTTTNSGTNPVQVGTGAKVSSIDTITTVGSTQTTGVSTDVSIGGEGYLVLKGDTKSDYQYTRAGNLSVDSEGNLNVVGSKVCGWLSYVTDADGNYVYNTDAKPETINIYSDSYNGNKKTIAAEATTEADFSGNLDPTKTVATTATALTTIVTDPSTYDQSSSITVYDAQGASHEVTVNWKKCYVDSASNTTSWYYSLSSDDASVTLPGGTASSGYVLFDSNGAMVDASVPTASNTTAYTAANISAGTSLLSTSGAGNCTVDVAAGSVTGSYALTLTDPAGTTYTATTTNGAASFTNAAGEVVLTLSKLTTGTLTAGTQLAFTTYANTSKSPTVTVTPDSGSTAAFDVVLNMKDVTTNKTSSTSAVTTTADGCKAGELQSIAISADGTIVGSYSNDQTQALGKIAVAVFANAGGLDRSGSNVYTASANSGEATIVAAGSGGSGSLSAGTLEMSNVDLAEQMSAMMINQRAYQANTKIITAANEMLQTVIGMVG